jgi:Caspase domain/Domain of unknown function (DUF4384)
MKNFLILSLLLFTGFAHSQVSERKALIIGVSEYSNPEIEKLRGVPHDMQSATKIAVAMGIAEKNIKYIKNSEATKANIMAALRQAGDSTNEGTRAFVYYSGHGTRYPDPKTGECIDGLLTYDAQAITNAEFANASRKLTQSSDKVITMIDACFSEGVVGSKSKTRSLDLAQFSPKFQSKSNAESCKPINVLTRGLLPEVTRLGGLQENFVQITSSRPDEVSYDDANSGGVATQSIRDCLLGKAVDLNGSGAVTMGEVETCAQSAVDKMLKSSNVTQHITVSGSRNLIPVSFKEPPKPEQQLDQSNTSTVISTPVVPVSAPTSAPIAVPTPLATPSATEKPNESAKPPAQIAQPQIQPNPAPAQLAQSLAQQPQATVSQAKPPTPAFEPAIASLATLKDIEQQRNPKRSIEVKVNKPTLKIGKDLLDLSIKSKTDGYLYLVLLGSDASSFYLLYPNGLESDNFIKAGQTVKVPKPDWGIKAAGPEGTDRLLVMVSDSPRKLDTLQMAKPTEKAPYTFALNDLGGRSALINYLTGSGIDGKSESFGAQLISIKEVK